MAVVLSAGTVTSGSGTVTPILMRRLNGDGTADADALEAGDKVEHYYYAGWRVIEETDAASTPHVLAQTVCADGVDGQDAHPTQPVCRDRNTDSIYNSGSSDSDCLDSGGSQRYFYHQDANFRVVMLTDESGAAVERYDYDAYGEPRIWAGVGGAGVSPAETGSLLSVSRVGNPLMHQGLRRDDETGLHENRMRVLHSRLGRFMQRDPLGYINSLSLYSYVFSNPELWVDPLGDQIRTTGGIRPESDDPLFPKASTNPPPSSQPATGSRQSPDDPPIVVGAPKDRWYGYNDREFQRWVHGQKGKGAPDFTKKELDELWEAFKKERGSKPNPSVPKRGPNAPRPPGSPPPPQAPPFSPPSGSGDSGDSGSPLPPIPISPIPPRIPPWWLWLRWPPSFPLFGWRPSLMGPEETSDWLRECMTPYD